MRKPLRLLLKEFFKDKFNVTTLQTGHGCMDHMYTNPVPKGGDHRFGVTGCFRSELITRLRKESKMGRYGNRCVGAPAKPSTDRIAALRAGADDYFAKAIQSGRA